MLIILLHDSKMNRNIGLTSIVDDLDRYADTFKTAFLPNSSDVDVIRAWLRNDFDKEFISEISQRFPSDKEICVMGVGTGDGSTESIIIDCFRQKFKKLRYTVIEPGSVIEEFKSMVNSNEMKDVVFDWRNSKLSQVCQETTSYRNKFAFISAMHSVYYFDDFDEECSHLFDFLAKGGALMIMVNTEDNVYMKFLDCLSWKASNCQNGFTMKVAQFAETRGLPLRTFDISGKIDVTSCFNEDSEEGGKLLDFLTEIAFFRETASSDIKNETMSVMKSLAIEDKDGKLYFETKCQAMIMNKPHKSS